MTAEYQYVTLPLHLIDPPTEPSRITLDPEALGALADDIAANGLLQPIGVTGPDDRGRYVIGFGHRRTEAHRLLQRGTIEAKVWPWGTNTDVMQASENGNREQLTPIEEAREVAKFLRKGHSQAGVARLLRRSTAWVASRIAVGELPDELQAAVHAGDVSIGVALALAQIDHADYRASLVDEAARTGASLPVVNVWVAHYTADKARIVSNHLTVQEIAEARADFKVFYTCPACRLDVDYTRTLAMRFCATCAAEVQQQLTQPEEATR